MKKIFLYAYDRINLGDDLFIRTICSRYPNVKFYLWSKAYNRKVFNDVKNLKVLDQESKYLNTLTKIRPSLFSRYKSKMEQRCEAVVYIGGSIFIEYENWKSILSWWDYEALNRKFYILGANFGPYKTEAYREKLAGILGNVQDICFRDKYSYDLFSDVSTVRYAPDILFNYEFPETSVNKQVFISVIDCASRDSGLDKLSDKEDAYINLLLKYVKNYIEKGYRIVLSSFCKIERDEDTINKIMESLDSNLKNMVKIINYDGSNIYEITSSIAESKLIISSRFHGTVLGFAASKPVLPIVYSDKTINILKDLNFTGKYIDIRNIDNDSYINLEDNYDCQTIKDIQKIKSDCTKHFIKLDSLLEI